MSNPREFMQRFFDEIWTAGRAALIDELVASDCTIQGLGAPMRGSEPFKHFHAMFNLGYRDIKIRIDDFLTEGDRSAMRCSLTATHRKTGTRATIRGGGIVRIRDGRLVEAWNQWDFLDLAQQVGVVPLGTFAAAISG